MIKLNKNMNLTTDNDMNQFEVGKRYEIHNAKEGLSVIGRQDNMLLVNIKGEKMLKKIGNFTNSEFVWTDSWHVCMARKEVEEE